MDDAQIRLCQNGTEIIIQKNAFYTVVYEQYKTQKIRPENSRAGLSYTVASIGFVTTKPERRKPKGAHAPVTPKLQ